MEPGIIHTIFAEAAPNPTIAWNVILTIGVLVAIAVNVASLFKKPSTAITPDPLRIEKLDKLATREFVATQFSEAARRLSGHDADITAIRQDMKEDRRNNEVHASQRSAGLHTKIDNVRVELSDKIDGMESRIIATLKNTGAI